MADCPKCGKPYTEKENFPAKYICKGKYLESNACTYYKHEQIGTVHGILGDGMPVHRVCIVYEGGKRK